MIARAGFEPAPTNEKYYQRERKTVKPEKLLRLFAGHERTSNEFLDRALFPVDRFGYGHDDGAVFKQCHHAGGFRNGN
jgi:hypothetical protein